MQSTVDLAIISPDKTYTIKRNVQVDSSIISSLQNAQKSADFKSSIHSASYKITSADLLSALNVSSDIVSATLCAGSIGSTIMDAGITIGSIPWACGSLVLQGIAALTKSNLDGAETAWDAESVVLSATANCSNEITCIASLGVLGADAINVAVTTFSNNSSVINQAQNDLSNTSGYTISGTVSGVVVSGVTITLTGEIGSGSATTDSSGNYSFGGITNGDSCTITPSKAGYTFSPISRSVTVNSADVTGQNFTVTAPGTTTYSMSGTIHVGNNSGAVLSGATISIAGLTATTGSTGAFTITGIPSGTYAFTVSKSGYDTYTNPAYYVGSDQTGLNFYLTAIIVPPPSNDYTSANIGTLKYVPAGSFQRDATASNISTVSAFRMSQYEITRAQFRAIMGTDPSDTGSSTGTSDPVQMVNWYHAIAFCNKLSIAEGLTPVYSVSGVNFTTLMYADVPSVGNSATWDEVTVNWNANGYRLPTEMEWMWVAMGATSGYGYTSGTYTTGYTKAFAGSTGSNAIGDYAWYSGNSGSTTHPIGTKLPNELGIYDMSGNVWEWCWDWWGSYPAGTQTNYRGASSGSYRVGRGGGFMGSAEIATVAYRDYDFPYNRFTFVGFRIVRP